MSVLAITQWLIFAKITERNAWLLVV